MSSSAFLSINLSDAYRSALKLRYLLPIQISAQLYKSNMAGLPPLLSSVIHHQPSYSASDTLIPFDAKVVAHKEEGWEGMLKSVLILWVQKIVEERRLYH